MSQDHIERGHAIREFGDLVNHFIHTVLRHPNAENLVRNIESHGLSFPGIIHAASDVMDKTSSAYEGLAMAFEDLGNVDGRNYEIEKKRILQHKG